MDGHDGLTTQDPGESDLAFESQGVSETEELGEGGEYIAGRNRIAVLKFGGSSVAGADRLLRACRIVQDSTTTQKVAVVVSAMRGITDQLYSVARHLRSGARGLAMTEAERIVNLHRGVLQDLDLRGEEVRRVAAEIEQLCRELLQEVNHERLDGTSLERMDRIVSFGERLSCRLMAGALRKLGTNALAVEASEFLATSCDFQSASPHLEVTVKRAGEIFPDLFAKGVVPVVTGFLGATLDGRITTLGRNSSDFSAAIVAHALGASELIIWTDVDGMYTENPRQSASARLLSELSYTSAQALAASGAKVLHRDVIPLAAKTRMRVAIRNTLNPQARGTVIGPHSELAQ